MCPLPCEVLSSTSPRRLTPPSRNLQGKRPQGCSLVTAGAGGAPAGRVVREDRSERKRRRDHILPPPAPGRRRPGRIPPRPPAVASQHVPDKLLGGLLAGVFSLMAATAFAAAVKIAAYRGEGPPAYEAM